MPFTLAHPIAILPFSRCRYCYFPALVIGSLSPDFVYFLHGRAVSGGHGLADMLWPNLPLCFAVYWLYLALWRDTLSDFLPNCLNAAPYRPSENVDFHKIKAVALAFIPSALFGMGTHLFLDAFTHPTGWFVQHFPVLQQTVLFLPIFQMAAIRRRCNRRNRLPVLYIPHRPPPAIPLSSNHWTKIPFLDSLYHTVAPWFFHLANHCSRTVRSCCHTNNPPD